MHLADKPQRFGEHRNAFGFLRLLFASLVIVSHVPEIVDNGSRREILHRLAGGMTFGSVAVFGFFLISGYLITGSLISSRSYLSYFKKRIARIYPGFIVASIVCLVIVAPLAGASFKHGPILTVASSAAHMAILGRPAAEHPFAGQNFSDSDSGLNGAMWTIQYEFACYLLVALLGWLGLVRGRAIIGMAAALIAIGTWMPFGELRWIQHPQLFPGQPAALFQLSGMFLSGAAWYLYRDRVEFPKLGLLLAALGLAMTFGYASTSIFGYALFGGYLIFGVAKLGAGTWLERINNRTDISYGVYVYGWPAEQLLIRYMGSDNLLLLGLGTWAIALACGWLSWTFVEKPALILVKPRQQVRVLKEDAAPATS